MSSKKTVKKVSKKVKVIKKVGGSKSKAPKFKFVSYTLGAVIPVGAYANIQPSVTIEAKSIEQAERILMPYIEALFAKYRGTGPVVPTAPVAPARPVVAQPQAPVRPQPTAQAPVAPVKPQEEPKKTPEAPVAPVEVPIVLTVPFNRAKSAVESCTSKEALKVVSDQITKSVKLTPEEKNTLIMLVSDKSTALDGVK